MPNQPDDLDAVRTIADTLSAFDQPTQIRIVRWACEKIGLADPLAKTSTDTTAKSTVTESAPATPGKTGHAGNPATDIKTFVLNKNPSSNNEFAACVAYYYQFEAPPAERKESIVADDLQEACRLVSRERLSTPGQTLVHAHTGGLLDKAGERGAYSISTVGENLVAMTLPADGSNGTAIAKRKTTKRKTTKKKKTAKKKSGKKKSAAKKKGK